jgi:hypothetical protein
VGLVPRTGLVEGARHEKRRTDGAVSLPGERRPEERTVEIE